MATFS